MKAHLQIYHRYVGHTQSYTKTIQSTFWFSDKLVLVIEFREVALIVMTQGMIYTHPITLDIFISYNHVQNS